MSDSDIATVLMTIAKTGTIPVVLMVCGNNGSGKTTKVNQIAAMIRKNKYTVSVVTQDRETTNEAFMTSLNRSLGMSKHMAIKAEIRDLTDRIGKINVKIAKDSADSDLRITLSKECVKLNNQIIKLNKDLQKCPINYTHQVVIIDRTAVCKKHRMQIDFDPYKIPRTHVVAVMMTTPVEVCIDRKCKNLNEKYAKSMAKFIKNLDKMTEKLSSDEEYAAMFECDGSIVEHTEPAPTKVVRRPKVVALDTTKPNVWSVTTPTRNNDTNGGGAPREKYAFKPVPVNQIPTTTNVPVNVRKMMGTAAVLDIDERIKLINRLENMKTAGQIGKDALGRSISVATSTSITRTSRSVTAKSFKNMLAPGSKIKMFAYAYVCDHNIGCLLMDIKIDGKRVTSGHSFMTIDMSIGSTGNAIAMLNSGNYNKYKFKAPIEIVGTIALILRDANGDDEFVYDVRDIAPLMFDLLAN